MKLLVTSKSEIKISAVKEVMDYFHSNKGCDVCEAWDPNDLCETCEIKECEITGINVSPDNQCAQPFNMRGGGMACWSRIYYLLTNYSQIYDYDYIISIENYIDVDNKTDNVYVIVHSIGENRSYSLAGAAIPLPDLDNNSSSEILQLLTQDEQFSHELGATKTYGAIYHEKFPDVPADNWMAFSGELKNRRDRKDCIKEVLSRLIKDRLLHKLFFQNKLRKGFRQYSDFPKKGVKFEDWSDIFLNSQLFQELIDYLGEKYTTQGSQIDYVMGLESRGYFLAAPLALNLNAGFVPIKKPGKTPPPTITESYTKEYGTDTLELRSDLKPGRVLIVDDVLATGGSLAAAIKLCETANHTVVEAITIKDVPALRQEARKKLLNHNIRVILWTQ